MESADQSRSHGFEAQIRQWAHTWGLPGLEGRLSVVLSSRFRTSLGRCAPLTGEIRLASALLEGPREILDEALCHEAAHAAVHVKYRRRRRPHGEEWQALMRAAGYEPRRRIPAEELLRRGYPLPKQNLWEHRCLVCHSRRLARTRVSRWRCAACRSAGLEGELLVTRVEEGRGKIR